MDTDESFDSRLVLGIAENARLIANTELAHDIALVGIRLCRPTMLDEVPARYPDHRVRVSAAVSVALFRLIADLLDSDSD